MATANAHPINVCDYAPRGPLTPLRMKTEPGWSECPCLICERPFTHGVWYDMVPVAPTNREEYEKAMRGEEHIAELKPAHWECIVIRLASFAGLLRMAGVA